MHFLPQTRHGISDFDCLLILYFCNGTEAIDADLDLAADRHQQILVSENYIDSFRVDSTPIAVITLITLFMDLLVAFTCECLILFKTMLFVCAWVLTELLLLPVYVWKQMSPLSILGGKKLYLRYCLKLSCNYNNPAYAIIIVICFFILA